MNTEELIDVVTRENINLAYLPLKKAKAAALIGGIAIKKEISGKLEEKEIIAHELGHIRCGLMPYRLSDPVLKRKCEICADRAAVRLLIPKNALFKAIKHGLREPWSLAEHFEVSENFIKKAIDYYFL